MEERREKPIEAPPRDPKPEINLPAESIEPSVQTAKAVELKPTENSPFDFPPPGDGPFLQLF